MTIQDSIYAHFTPKILVLGGAISIMISRQKKNVLQIRVELLDFYVQFPKHPKTHTLHFILNQILRLRATNEKKYLTYTPTEDDYELEMSHRFPPPTY